MGLDIYNINIIKSLLQRHGFRFSKSMGQNFLVDPQIPAETIRLAGIGRGQGVLEIGPGIGALTLPLSQAAGRVVSVELDKALLPLLGETLAGQDNVEIVQGDILKLDISQLVQDRLRGLEPVVCANLPYNITTPVLTALLEAGCFSAITVMVQREVAQRICAKPGTAAYGAFSLFVQYHAQPEILLDVPPDCFIPQPKVYSAVLHLKTLPLPPVSTDPALLFRVIRAAFAQRRKTLVNGLTAAFSPGLSKEQIGQVLADCGLPSTIRGETLSLGQFAEISEKISDFL